MTPDGWRNLAVKDLADIVSGVGFPRKHQGSQVGKIPFFKVSDMNTQGNERGLRVAANTVDRALLDSLKGKLHPPGTVVFPKVGAALLTNKRRRLVVPSCFDNNVMGLVATGCDPDYLYLLMQAVDFADHVQSGAIPSINGSTVGGIRVLVPPLPEQRKIAAILSSVDDAIEKTQAVIDQVQVVKRGLMQELLTRGLPGRHTRFKQTEIGEIPEEWEIVRIIDVADVDYGISAAVSANTDPGIGWPILTGANLTLDGQIDLSKLVYHEPPSKERFFLRKNDLLLNWRSGSPKHVGKTALFDLEGNYTYASFVLRIRSLGKLVPGFGHVLLNFMRNAEFFSKDLSQQVNFKMNAAVFREVLIRLPSVDEQEEIALTAARFDSRLAGEAQSIAALQNVKAALMSALLTGELRVTPDLELA